MHDQSDPSNAGASGFECDNQRYSCFKIDTFGELLFTAGSVNLYSSSQRNTMVRRSICPRKAFFVAFLICCARNVSAVTLEAADALGAQLKKRHKTAHMPQKNSRKLYYGKKSKSSKSGKGTYQAANPPYSPPVVQGTAPTSHSVVDPPVHPGNPDGDQENNVVEGSGTTEGGFSPEEDWTGTEPPPSQGGASFVPAPTPLHGTGASQPAPTSAGSPSPPASNGTPPMMPGNPDAVQPTSTPPDGDSTLATGGAGQASPPPVNPMNPPTPPPAPVTLPPTPSPVTAPPTQPPTLVPVIPLPTSQPTAPPTIAPVTLPPPPPQTPAPVTKSPTSAPVTAPPIPPPTLAPVNILPTSPPNTVPITRAPVVSGQPDTTTPEPTPQSIPPPNPTPMIPVPTPLSTPQPSPAPPTIAPVVGGQPAPSVPPVADPTMPPMPSPTNSPLVSPTEPPLPAPTTPPVADPTRTPTPPSTNSPIVSPSEPPLPAPTTSPVADPTRTPTPPSTNSPIVSPSEPPLPAPTTPPVADPTRTPTPVPTTWPFVTLTDLPLPAPTAPPATNPTVLPTPVPTVPPATDPSIPTTPAATDSTDVFTTETAGKGDHLSKCVSSPATGGSILGTLAFDYAMLVDKDTSEVDVDSIVTEVESPLHDMIARALLKCQFPSNGRTLQEGGFNFVSILSLPKDQHDSSTECLPEELSQGTDCHSVIARFTAQFRSYGDLDALETELRGSVGRSMQSMDRTALQAIDQRLLGIIFRGFLRDYDDMAGFDPLMGGDEDTEESRSGSSGNVAAATIGTAAGALLVVGLLVVRRRRNRRAKDGDDTTNTVDKNQANSTFSSGFRAVFEEGGSIEMVEHDSVESEIYDMSILTASEAPEFYGQRTCNVHPPSPRVGIHPIEEVDSMLGSSGCLDPESDEPFDSTLYFGKSTSNSATESDAQHDSMIASIQEELGLGASAAFDKSSPRRDSFPDTMDL